MNWIKKIPNLMSQIKAQLKSSVLWQNISAGFSRLAQAMTRVLAQKKWQRVLGLIIIVLSFSKYLPITSFDGIRELSSTIENVLYDYRVKLLATGHDDRIVILDIDEKSLKAEGHWPWSRDRVADVVNVLFEHYDIGVLGFDVLFAEENYSLSQAGRNKMKAAMAKKEKPNLYDDLLGDPQLAQALKGRPVVMAYTFFGNTEGSQVGQLPAAVWSAEKLNNTGLAPVQWQSYVGNLAMFQNNVASAGYNNPYMDADGLDRKIPMVSLYQGHYYESLSLAVLRQFLGQPPLNVVFDGELKNAGTIEGLELGGLLVPTDHHFLSWIPFVGPKKSFPYYSLTDLLNKRIAVDQLRGKIVLLGTSAAGLRDLRATPMGPSFPGVEVHANMIAGVLDGTVKHVPFYARVIELVMVLVYGLQFLISGPNRKVVGLSYIFISSIVSALAISYFFLTTQHVVLPMFHILGIITVLFLLYLMLAIVKESSIRAKVSQTFGQYIPEEVVKEIISHPELMIKSSDNRELTILFSDIRGFTTLSEHLDPGQVTDMLNELLTPLSEVIQSQHGTIDKYIGDAIMAFWNAPLPDEHHASHAISAALIMLKKLADLGDAFEARGWPRMDMGIGINSGRTNVGNMGSALRRSYTAIGDAVNLASRTESLTKDYGVKLLVTESTAAAAPEYLYRPIDTVRVKGKAIAIAMYEPVALKSQASAALFAEVAMMKEAMEAAAMGDQQHARELFLSLRANKALKVYDIHLERLG